jgi:hypothetical protein
VIPAWRRTIWRLYSIPLICNYLRSCLRYCQRRHSSRDRLPVGPVRSMHLRHAVRRGIASGPTIPIASSADTARCGICSLVRPPPAVRGIAAGQDREIGSWHAWPWRAKFRDGQMRSWWAAVIPADVDSLWQDGHSPVADEGRCPTRCRPGSPGSLPEANSPAEPEHLTRRPQRSCRPYWRAISRPLGSDPSPARLASAHCHACRCRSRLASPRLPRPSSRRLRPEAWPCAGGTMRASASSRES